MGGKRIAGIVCFFLAAGLLISGVLNIMRGPEVTDASGVGVSDAVGAMLPSIAITIVGLLLFKKTPE
jgi:hypothetical protein